MHSTRGDRSNADANAAPLAALTKICAMVGAVWFLVLSAPQVEAAIGGSATPTWPPTVAVSTTFSASVVIVNLSPPGNDTESISLIAFFVTPACADNVSVICLPGNRDPGVFDVLAAVGDARSAPCAGTVFSVGAQDSVTGEVQLIPTSAITLGPASGPVDGRTCRINLSIRVNKLPANPAGGVTSRTDPLTHVALHGVTSGLNGSAGSSAQVTVNRGTPSIQTVSAPVGPLLPAGIRARDSAAVFGLDGAIAPTGSVTFFLCQPNQVNDAQGCGSGGTQVGSAKTLNGITESDETSNTTALGKYCWRVEYSGDTNYLPASHTDAAGECFVVQHPQAEMATQPNPDNGTVRQTTLNDVAILQGTNPSGTITFRLFAPDDPTCVNAIFTEVVPVHGNGSYSTSSGFPATSVTQPGTYQWTVEYSGDCCNGSMASTCGQEPVIIRAAAGPPVPTLSEWGMLAFVTVLLALGSFMLRRRRA